MALNYNGIIVIVFSLTAIYEVRANKKRTEDAERTSVVIVGAGAAGLAAVTRLYQNGIEDVIVLEAENRIGGRIHSVLVENGGVLEMGAQWIHGQLNNVVHELVTTRRHSNLMCPSKAFQRMEYARSTGDPIRPHLVCSMNEIFCKLFKDHEYSEEEFDTFKTCGDFFVREIETELEKRGDAVRDMSDGLRAEFVELCHRALNLSEGSESWYDVSTNTFADCPVCEGDFYLAWNGVGYDTLFDILMQDDRRSSANYFYNRVVWLGSEVQRISLMTQEEEEEEGGSILVECSNGRRIRTDHVIVTASVGVLRERRSKLFERFPLPESKIRAIDNLGFGTVDKIQVEFPEPWWPAESGAFNLLWTKADREEYAKMGVEWATDLFQFHVVDAAPNVLCGWITRAAARAMEAAPEPVVLETVTRVLRQFLGKRWNVADPVRLYRSTWYSNEHFRGSYSNNRTLRTEESNVSAHTLSTPVNDGEGRPILLFAGEATSSEYPASVNGAIESGWREADRIIDYLRKN